MSASGTERGCPARRALPAGGGRCVPGRTGRCGCVDVGEGLPSTMRMSASKRRKPTLAAGGVARGPARRVDADSAPALPRDSAMSAMACGKHVVRLVGAIPASGPMTIRVPPSIRERMRARGPCHMAAGDHDLDHSRAADRVVTNRILHATGTAGGAAGEPAVAAWREASLFGRQRRRGYRRRSGAGPSPSG